MTVQRDRSVLAVLFGTFTLRFSTGLTGGLLTYYLADLPDHGGPEVGGFVLGLLVATYYLAELVLSPGFGVLSDRLGRTASCSGVRSSAPWRCSSPPTRRICR